MPAFSIQREHQDQVARVIVRGEFDVDTGPRVAEELLAAESAAPATLVLDLREVSFFDSTALKVVLDAQLRAGEDGRQLVVLADHGEPRRVLELAEVTQYLDLRESDTN
jgi:anti-anti-sigma factor